MAGKYLGEYVSHVCSSGKRSAIGLFPNMPSPDPQCGRLRARGTQACNWEPSTPGPVRSLLDSLLLRVEVEERAEEFRVPIS